MPAELVCATSVAFDRSWFEGPSPRVRALVGVGARMRPGLRASNRRARHLPMRYETGSAKLGHPVQNVTREHGLTPLPR